ncbi:unnamed protein product, partial [Cyprideis torosa]
PDGQFIASGSSEDNVKIWDAQSGQLLNTLHLSEWGTESTGQRVNLQRLEQVLQKAKDQLGRKYVSVTIRTTIFSPDGQFIASDSDDNTIRIWDVQTRQVLQILQGHSAPISSVAFSPDGQFITSGSDDNTVRIWDVQTGQSLKTLQGHGAHVLSVAYSPDGQFIASTSNDG